MERIEKPYEFQKHYKFPTILLLSPMFPDPQVFPKANSMETPWSEWKPIGTDRILIRESVGFIPSTEPIYGDYVPGSLYEILKSSGSRFADIVQPLEFPHYSLIG